MARNRTVRLLLLVSALTGTALTVSAFTEVLPAAYAMARLKHLSRVDDPDPPAPKGHPSYDPADDWNRVHATVERLPAYAFALWILLVFVAFLAERACRDPRPTDGPSSPDEAIPRSE